jgi:hypothetical protein
LVNAVGGTRSTKIRRAVVVITRAYARPASPIDRRNVDVIRWSTDIGRVPEFQNCDRTSAVVERSDCVVDGGMQPASVPDAISEETVVSHAIADVVCGLAPDCAHRIVPAATATAEIILPIKAVAGIKSYARGNVRAVACRALKRQDRE